MMVYIFYPFILSVDRRNEKFFYNKYNDSKSLENVLRIKFNKT